MPMTTTNQSKPNDRTAQEWFEALDGHTVYFVSCGSHFHAYHDCAQLKHADRSPHDREASRDQQAVSVVGFRDMCSSCKTKMRRDPRFVGVQG